jgi:hypothetical protein
MATPAVRRYIQGQFDRFARQNKLEVLVEKTCANSLRVGFVNEVIPGAKYIFIVRDGLDAVGSALIRWRAELDILYLLKKVRYVPPIDLPYYGLKYFGNRLYRLFSDEKRLATWGPVLEDMHEVFASHPLDEACAIQWAACVNDAERDFSRIPSNNVLRVKYEDLVTNPVSEFSRVAEFINQPMPPEMERKLRRSISSDSVGKGRKQLGEQGIARISPIITETMRRYGYATK